MCRLSCSVSPAEYRVSSQPLITLHKTMRLLQSCTRGALREECGNRNINFT